MSDSSTPGPGPSSNEPILVPAHKVRGTFFDLYWGPQMESKPGVPLPANVRNIAPPSSNVDYVGVVDSDQHAMRIFLPSVVGEVSEQHFPQGPPDQALLDKLRSHADDARMIRFTPNGKFRSQDLADSPGATELELGQRPRTGLVVRRTEHLPADKDKNLGARSVVHVHIVTWPTTPNEPSVEPKASSNFAGGWMNELLAMPRDSQPNKNAEREARILSEELLQARTPRIVLAPAETMRTVGSDRMFLAEIATPNPFLSFDNTHTDGSVGILARNTGEQSPLLLQVRVWDAKPLATNAPDVIHTMVPKQEIWTLTDGPKTDQGTLVLLPDMPDGWVARMSFSAQENSMPGVCLDFYPHDEKTLPQDRLSSHAAGEVIRHATTRDQYLRRDPELALKFGGAQPSRVNPSMGTDTQSLGGNQGRPIHRSSTSIENVGLLSPTEFFDQLRIETDTELVRLRELQFLKERFDFHKQLGDELTAQRFMPDPQPIVPRLGMLRTEVSGYTEKEYGSIAVDDLRMAALNGLARHARQLNAGVPGASDANGPDIERLFIPTYSEKTNTAIFVFDARDAEQAEVWMSGAREEMHNAICDYIRDNPTTFEINANQTPAEIEADIDNIANLLVPSISGAHSKTVEFNEADPTAQLEINPNVTDLANETYINVGRNLERDSNAAQLASVQMSIETELDAVLALNDIGQRIEFPSSQRAVLLLHAQHPDIVDTETANRVIDLMNQRDNLRDKVANTLFDSSISKEQQQRWITELNHPELENVFEDPASVETISPQTRQLVADLAAVRSLLDHHDPQSLAPPDIVDRYSGEDKRQAEVDNAQFFIGELERFAGSDHPLVQQVHETSPTPISAPERQDFAVEPPADNATIDPPEAASGPPTIDHAEADVPSGVDLPGDGYAQTVENNAAEEQANPDIHQDAEVEMDLPSSATDIDNTDGPDVSGFDNTDFDNTDGPDVSGPKGSDGPGGFGL